MSVFAVPFASFVNLVEPWFGAGSAAAAIVLFTALVRLALLPLSRAAARGQQARTRLAPRMAELQTRYGKDPERLRKAVLELHAKEGVSPLAGCLPSALQLPAFLLMYHLFASGGAGDHLLFAAPLAGRWTDALADGGVFGPAGVVYAGLFVVVAVVATYSYRFARELGAGIGGGSGASGAGGAGGAGGAVARVMPFLAYGTLVTVAVVPLAAALYVVTSTTWTVVERAVLYRHTAKGSATRA
ncbi:YidC/Oxa1 family membrane protein insertase [Streptomyces sp. NPDC047928]|uniref:YidC/Oxa1 family membrane protein insertase n=1 Tax=unclassified Streptomyces TaxID=2593676 RepID=UPI0037171603